MLKLYSYFRSSASYRVRIALHWKELPFEYIPIHLTRNGGEQHQAHFRKINPMGHVPALDHNGFLVSESMAIIDYLDQVYPQRPLFPQSLADRARVLQICEIINSGIQPLQNLKVGQFLVREMGVPEDATDKWCQHWIIKGFESLEKILASTAGTYCLGGEFTAADCFLVPQCHSARRFGVKVEDFPIIARIDAAVLELPAVQAARPGNQPDSV